MAKRNKTRDVRLCGIRMNESVPEHAAFLEAYRQVDFSKRAEWLRFHLLRSFCGGWSAEGDVARAATDDSGNTSESLESRVEDGPPIDDFLKVDV